MAGSSASFNAAGFRTAIRKVYTLAAPVSEAEQVSFHFTTTTTYDVPVDGDGVPFDPTAVPVKVTPAPLRVACGVEQANPSDVATAFGVVVATRIKCYLLDEEYAKVKDAIFIVLGGEKFNYHHTEAPAGLFNVGMYTMVFIAENDL